MRCSFITRVFSREIKIYKPNDGNYLVHCWMLHLHLQTEIQPLFRMSEKEWFSLTELRNVINRIQYLCLWYFGRQKFLWFAFLKGQSYWMFWRISFTQSKCGQSKIMRNVYCCFNSWIYYIFIFWFTININIDNVTARTSNFDISSPCHSKIFKLIFLEERVLFRWSP